MISSMFDVCLRKLAPSFEFSVRLTLFFVRRRRCGARCRAAADWTCPRD
jgi:hypothetical protein